MNVSMRDSGFALALIDAYRGGAGGLGLRVSPLHGASPIGNRSSSQSQ